MFFCNSPDGNCGNENVPHRGSSGHPVLPRRAARQNTKPLTMLRTLLAKDLRRARRNPVPWLIQLIVPLVITGIVGALFSPRTNSGGVGEIRLGYVDEDRTWLTDIFQQALGPENAGLKMKVEPLAREEAMRRINANELAAVVIVPQGFTDAYTGLQPVRLELIKNPANVIHPTIVEEFLVTLATGMNALARVAGPEFAVWRREIESTDSFNLIDGMLLVADAAKRIEPARDYLRPPLVGYATQAIAPAPATGTATTSQNRGAGAVFRFVLLGMGAMFLLFLADTAIRDLYRENTARTLARFRTLQHGLLGFVASKVVFAVVMVLLGAVILLGGGALAFQFTWQRPVEFGALIGSYAIFAGGLVALIAAVAGNERRAAMFNNITLLGLSVLGGCLFPLDGWALWREHIAPWVPTFWFAGTAREMQNAGGGGLVWVDDALKLLIAGVAGLVIAAWIFQRRLRKGVH